MHIISKKEEICNKKLKNMEENKILMPSTNFLRQSKHKMLYYH
uniref:Uncharacterized protein n=1 Tax=Myoviridae sp. ct8mY9 TaxID=2827664 RepID=A0A8S5SF28_9CAUD|nr:MAG TPA: hypothetical protein [Myoviridae sp. ct8mY9]